MMYRKLSIVSLFIIISSSVFAQEKKVSVADVWKKYAFYDRTTGGLRSMNDGLHFTVLDRDENGPKIDKYSYESGEKVSTLLHASDITMENGQGLRFDSYQFNADESQVLLGTETEAIYRHSSKSNYFVYDLKSKELKALKAEDKQQLADFSPVANKVAFVHENRMHVQDLNDGKLISFGKGSEDKLIAGAVDWVYEEEFSFHKGFYWSPEGNYIAYYQFDETEVPTFSMDVYGKELYPQTDVFKYPKAGEVNSVVHIHIYDLENQKDFQVEIPADYEYIPRIKWTQEDDELVITTLNRHQDHLQLWEVEVEGEELEVEKLYEEKAPHYLEIHDNLSFLEDGSFIWTSEKDGFNHIYHYDEDGELIRQITQGDYEVTNFYGIDAESKTLFYQAAERSPLGRDVYRISLKGKDKKRLSEKEGWNSASFSKGFKFYIHRHSAADSPTFESLHRANGEQVRVINDNAALRKRLENYQISEKEFLQIPNAEGTLLNAWMIKPADFKTDQEYPVLMFVYGGPGSQTVKNQYDGFNDKWYQHLASQGYIVVSVDNRGTGARGRDFRTLTYQQLGKYEIADQISAAQWLGDQAYVDSSRIGIWGWSYGGYMSSLGITKGADVFKAAIAVAPVTNWRFYDNIYTERYMRTPQENAEGYDDNSPINHVEKLEGAYFLVHGSADDNVHVQNTMRMVEALVQANKQFDLFIYPDKNHGIFGGNTRYHLYTKMTEFILENL